MFCHIFCCILPMIGFILGMNLIGYTFHAYEGIFVALNLISIVFGFYYTYLHKVEKQCDHNHCHKKTKIAYWIATIISLIVMIIPHIIEKN